MFGYWRRANSGLVARQDLLGFETHDAVAFARRRRKPGTVDLDPAALLGPDRAARAQIAHQERHTPRICDNACWVSGSTSLSTRSRSWSSQRAMRVSTGCSALQAEPCSSWISNILMYFRTA